MFKRYSIIALLSVVAVFGFVAKTNAADPNTVPASRYYGRFIVSGDKNIKDAWYISPVDKRRYYFKNEADGFGKLFTGGAVRNIIPSRQFLPKLYAKNGAFYILKTKNLFRNPPSIFGRRVKLYIMGPEHNIDIDEPEDWHRAELEVKRIFNLEKHGR